MWPCKGAVSRLQAGVVAFGSPGNETAYGWNEERGTTATKSSSARIHLGLQKSYLQWHDFGVRAVDTGHQTLLIERELAMATV
jgi:hypothetical protein